MIDVKMEDRWIEEKTESDTGWVGIAVCVSALSYYCKASKHQSPPTAPTPSPWNVPIYMKIKITN